MKNRPLKTTNKIATENFIESTEKRHALELLGTDNLVREDPRDSFFTFQQIYGRKHSFYYLARLVDAHDDDCAEIGIGHIESTRTGKTLLIREQPIAEIKDNQYFEITDPVCFQHKEKGDQLIVESYTPKDVHQLLIDKNSILVSNPESRIGAESVAFENNSLLVCLKNKVVSVTIPELAELLKRYL